MNNVKAVVFSLVLLALPLATLTRNQTWYQEQWLWRDALIKSGGKARAHVNYGAALQNEVGTREAVEYAKYNYTLAVQKDKEMLVAYLNLGELLVMQGNYAAGVPILSHYAEYGKQKAKAYGLIHMARMRTTGVMEVCE